LTIRSISFEKRVSLRNPETKISGSSSLTKTGGFSALVSQLSSYWGWDEQKLERVVAGASVAGAGKRADALMRTAGLISSLCFVEIKLPTTPLLVQQRHRPEVWRASAELSSGVAQSHVTVEKARRAIGTKLLVEILTGSKQASAHLHPDHVPTFWLAAWISS
jgi:hypothetical protein